MIFALAFGLVLAIILAATALAARIPAPREGGNLDRLLAGPRCDEPGCGKPAVWSHKRSDGTTIRLCANGEAIVRERTGEFTKAFREGRA